MSENITKASANQISIVQRDIHNTSNPGIFAAHRMETNALIEIMTTGLKGLKTKEIVRLAEHYLLSCMGKASKPLEFEDLENPGRLAAIAGIAGWRAKETRFSKVTERTLLMFQKLLLECHGVKLPGLPDIISTGTTVNFDSHFDFPIPAQAQRSLMLEAIYGTPEVRIENGCAVIPLKAATGFLVSPDLEIKSRHVHISSKSFPRHFETYSKQVFWALVEAVDKSLAYPVKTKFVSETRIFNEVLASIINFHGPWALSGDYDNGDTDMSTYPAMEFIKNALEASGNMNELITANRLKSDLMNYQSSAFWETDVKSKLANLQPAELLALLVQNKSRCGTLQVQVNERNLIKISRPKKITLSSIEDFDSLMSFPCFSRAVREKAVPHQMRAAMFSTLLWFYNVEQCLDIIEKKIEVPDFDRDYSRYQLNSLLEPYGNEPKYCYGVNGFASYCIGYENCPRCWISGLKMPDRYHEKKKQIMQMQNRT